MIKRGSELAVGDVFRYPHSGQNLAIVDVGKRRPFLGGVIGRTVYAVGYGGKGRVAALTVIDREPYQVDCPNCSSPYYDLNYQSAHLCPTCGLGIRWQGPFEPAAARYGYAGGAK